MNILIGSDVRCIWTMRRSKAYSHFGEPAKDGDKGEVLRITELKDVTIVEFQSERGRVYCHTQNLTKNN